MPVCVCCHECLYKHSTTYHIARRGSALLCDTRKYMYMTKHSLLFTHMYGFLRWYLTQQHMNETIALRMVSIAHTSLLCVYVAALNLYILE